MGTFEHPLEIEPARGGEFVSIDALVDTGSTFSRLPADVVERLGYAPERSESFILGDGRIVEMGMSEARVRLNGKVTTTQIAIGGVGTQSLTGAVTLEQLLFAPDPINHRLIKSKGC